MGVLRRCLLTRDTWRGSGGGGSCGALTVTTGATRAGRRIELVVIELMKISARKFVEDRRK
jgi:hypothetical protein